VLVFDGDCGFCSSCARLLERRGVAIVPWQRADLEALGISAEEAAAAVRWVAPGGEVAGGAAAVAAALESVGPPWRLAGRFLSLPVVRSLAAIGYELVARNRHRLPGGTPACAADRGRR
jgi:predicted DCC family thiol-disulfide oxidoreductase YuxK